MYNSKEDFTRDALNCGSSYYSDSSLQPQKIDVAYAIYQKAKAGSILGITVVGRLQLKTQGADGEFVLIPSDETFPSIDEDMKKNLLTLDEDFNQQSGSILSSQNWSLLANDAWVLGGLHALTEFHFASPLRWSNLWDENKRRIFVTAREVIGITSFGYKLIRPQPKLEAVAVCVDEQAAKGASLLTYKQKVFTYSAEADLQQFFALLPSEVKK
ncbi:hypothetical protein [Anabaena azotica]|uniref:Uncharacterized protein n=1 Tax=Anabaena azotica FACHB-119 TaxID=947527 RepID=A0ABR8DI87_9NOST|nr:hypothetical protein [Anabaena azotica]MBD2505493.1 hypothetical protein [Anabaena azotica FACHB-119]